MTPPEASNTTVRDFRQEEEHIDRRWLVIAAAIVLPLLVVLAALAQRLFTRASRRDAAQGVPTRPDPAAEVSGVHAELFERPLAGELLEQQQRNTLDRYGWVDREHGIVRVPINVAIELVAKDAKERP
jgi:hypothetical protein